MTREAILRWASKVCERYRIYEMFQGPAKRRARPGDWIEIPLERHDDGSIMTEEEMKEAFNEADTRND